MEDKRIPKKMLIDNPKGRRKTGCPQLRWKDQHTLKRAEHTKHGLIHGDDDDDLFFTRCVFTNAFAERTAIMVTV
jgi:hypothetical protein